jgi:mono/diheme cytochrome c family protein
LGGRGAAIASPGGSGGSCVGGSVARPVALPRVASSVVVAKLGERTVALVADEDAKAIDAIDLGHVGPPTPSTPASADPPLRLLASTPVGGTPSALLFLPDGRLAVTLRDRSEVRVFGVTADGGLVQRCASPTPDEPVGLATTPDDRTLLVSSGFGHALTSLDASSLAPRWTADLGREPRAVAVSDDGKTAFVAHMVGARMSAVDLVQRDHPVRVLSMRGSSTSTVLANRKKARQPIPAPEPGEGDEADPGTASCQGFALAKSADPKGRLFAPQVFVTPGGAERTDGYGPGDSDTETPSVAVVDEGTAAPLDMSVTADDFFRNAHDPRDHQDPCLLPRAAAVDAASDTLLVSCFGIDTVIGYNAASPTPAFAEKKRWRVGAGTTGLAAVPGTATALAWSAFDRTLHVLVLPDNTAPLLADPAMAATRSFELPPLVTAASAAYALGRQLFHSAGDSRVARDGRACASCHPDGRDDALTWSTPLGPRRSIMLAGRVASSAPYAWTGDERSIKEHLEATFDRLNGTGLRAIELDAIVAYISQMPAPPRAQTSHAAADPRVARGAAIFASSEAGCSGCHGNALLTDGSRHDVSSKTDVDKEAVFNTPSLRFIGGAGPYFHDGRYATLHDLLVGVDGTMGHTSHLSAQDLSALESYLRTL